LQEKDVISEGKERYLKGQYEAAERIYKQALRRDLINLNILYGEKLNKFREAVEINRMRIKIDDTLEAKTNLVESLLKAGHYEDARMYASQVMNTQKDNAKEDNERDPLMLYQDHLNYDGYQIINIFFILCSYLLEGDITKGREEFIKLDKSINEGFKIKKEQWVFEGLAKSVSANVNVQTKEVILTVIKLLEGNICKEDAKRKVENFLQP
jgi:tetratricopeptide (TPR) repeat protein